MTTISLRTARHRLGRLGLGAMIVACGCSSPDLSGPPTVDPGQLFWTMGLNTHAITLSTVAPYDTLQLTAVARSATGAPLPDSPAPTFISTDSSVRVSATGLLTARAPRAGVVVIADLTYGGVHLADTAMVTVTSDVPSPSEFDHLQLALLPGDSAKIAAPNAFSVFFFPGSKTLQTAARDANGLQIPGSQVALRVSDDVEAFVPSLTTDTTFDVQIFGDFSHSGPLTIHASATVYGITREDSLTLMITTPLMGIFNVVASATPGQHTLVPSLTPSDSAVIGVNGVVLWINGQSDSTDIVFDDPSAAVAAAPNPFPDDGSGNIANLAGATIPGRLNEGLTNVRIRQFPRAGVYPFHSTRLNIAGKVIVR